MDVEAGRWNLDGAGGWRTTGRCVVGQIGVYIPRWPQEDYRWLTGSRNAREEVHGLTCPLADGYMRRFCGKNDALS